MSALLRTVLIWLSLALPLAMGTERAVAQTITVDPATAVEGATSAIAFNHTVGSGANRLLIVSVVLDRNDTDVTAVTYAGQAMSQSSVNTNTGGTARVSVWALVAPATGTNQISVTLNRTAPSVVGAVSFSNVNQANAIASQAFGSANSGMTASASLASMPEHLLLAVLSANDSVGSATAGSGQTSHFNLLNLGDVIGAASTQPGATTSTTMTYSLANSGGWAMILMALDPAPSGLVTNTNDSGTGTLRSAVTWANAQGAPPTITFAIPGTGPHTITLSSALPDLTASGLTVDGTTQSGTQCRDLWVGSGHNLRLNVRGSSSFDGFRLGGINQTIRGLSISGFSDGLALLAASGAATIQCNYIGLLANGTSNSNSRRGVNVFGAGARIGGLGTGEGNVISSNSSFGVQTNSGSTDTAIRANFIGTDPTGMVAQANGNAINHLIASGSWRDITYNLISGNNSGAIVLESSDTITPSDGQVRIQRNRIGFNRTLSALLPNSGDGISFDNGSISNVLIGGIAASEGNTIGGNGNDAIDLRAVNNVIIRGNTLARASSRGIWIAGATNVTIGGTGAGEGNTIGGNGADGIFIGGNASNITVLGNQIQPITIAGANAAANATNGIWIERATTVNIGDGSAAGRNVIGGNGARGIFSSVANSNVTINGNYIGTDATGNASVIGGQNVGISQRDAISFEATNAANISILDNVIGGYGSAMIKFNESTANGVIIRGNHIGVGANGTTAIISGTNESLIAFGGGTRNYANVSIGGLIPGNGNLLANGGQNGITINSAQTGIEVVGNTIRNNSGNGVLLINPTRAAIIANQIFGNGILGIDLGADGPTANDQGDGDSGANDLLNSPMAVRAIANGSTALGYRFTLDAPAAADGYRIEFFANANGDPSGFGEGERYLGHVDLTHGGGAQSYNGTLNTVEPVNIGDIISATTTRRTAGGSWDITSEFSAVATADGVAALTVTMTSQVFEPPAGNPFATPGNVMLLTTTVNNNGSGSTDADSLFVAITIDPSNTFFNDVSVALGGVVGFTTGSPSLTFTPNTDLRFSNSPAAPTSIADCTYTPVAGTDPAVRHVCINPKGSLPSGGPQGQFTLQLRARIN